MPNELRDEGHDDGGDDDYAADDDRRPYIVQVRRDQSRACT